MARWPGYSPAKRKRAGHTYARVDRVISQKTLGGSYLLVDGVEGALVFAGVLVSDPLLQPVTSAPTTKPNSTIRVNILFIVGVMFTKTAPTTSEIFSEKTPVGRRSNKRLSTPPLPHHLSPLSFSQGLTISSARVWGACLEGSRQSPPKR